MAKNLTDDQLDEILERNWTLIHCCACNNEYGFKALCWDCRKRIKAMKAPAKKTITQTTLTEAQA